MARGAEVEGVDEKQRILIVVRGKTIDVGMGVGSSAEEGDFLVGSESGRRVSPSHRQDCDLKLQPVRVHTNLSSLSSS